MLGARLRGAECWTLFDAPVAPGFPAEDFIDGGERCPDADERRLRAAAREFDGAHDPEGNAGAEWPDESLVRIFWTTKAPPPKTKRPAH